MGYTDVIKKPPFSHSSLMARVASQPKLFAIETRKLVLNKGIRSYSVLINMLFQMKPNPHCSYTGPCRHALPAAGSCLAHLSASTASKTRTPKTQHNPLHLIYTLDVTSETSFTRVHDHKYIRYKPYSETSIIIDQSVGTKAPMSCQTTSRSNGVTDTLSKC